MALALTLVMVMVVSLFGYFYTFGVFSFIHKNKRPTDFTIFLNEVKDQENSSSTSVVEVLRTTYNIPIGDAMVEFIKLTNKKQKTNEESLFYNNVIELLNSMETIKFTPTAKVEI